MPQPPLRAVILDNDETTGSYGILFAIIATLQQIPTTAVFVQHVLERLATWMISHHCFRPGLRTLLTVLLGLRANRQIDAIIMYTNQKEQDHETGKSLLLYSVPKCIAYMMNYITGQGVFDHILARPDDSVAQQNGWIQKNFSRVLALYPERPNDIRNMIFVDDMASPTYIDANGIPKAHTDQGCWYRVDPYYRVLSDREFVSCITFCFGTDDPYEEFTPYVWNLYKELYAPQQKASTPNGCVFIHLTDALIKKYGYASKWQQVPRIPVPSLNMTRIPNIQNGPGATVTGANEGSQANSGASEGGNDNLNKTQGTWNQHL